MSETDGWEWAKPWKVGKECSDSQKKTLKTEQIATQDNLMPGEKEMKKNRDYKTPKKPKLERILKSSPPPSYTSFEPKGDSEVDGALILQHYDSAFRTLHDAVRKLYSQNQMMEN